MRKITWWRRLLGQKEFENQLDRELRFHFEQSVADLVAGGQTADEARRLARLAFGGIDQVKEQCRDARGATWLADLRQDLRYSLRILRQRPGFSAVALATLTLGIGATTVMFTVINGVLLKPLPYPQPERLVEMSERTDWASAYGNRWSVAYPNLLDCEREARSVDFAAMRFRGSTLSEPGDATYVYSRQVSAGLFSMLGVKLAHGREFSPDEDRPGGAPVAILSFELWQRLFGGSGGIGSRLVLDDQAYTVIGVTPRGLRLNDEEVELYTALGQDSSPAMQNRNQHRGISVVGRLRPGVSIRQAQSELGLIARHLEEQYPDSNRGRSFLLEPLRPDVDDVRSTLWLLLGAVTLVLVIACVNVASLLLARAVARERELAMRMALGAGRGRLVRQCLTESAVLGLIGGMLGAIVAVIGIRPFVLFWPGSLPRSGEVEIDWHVLLFAVGASLGCGLLFGIAPALRSPLGRLEQALRSGGRAVAGSSRLHGAYVSAELALAVVLLVSAGMLGRTLLRLSSLDPGIRLQNVLVTRAAISPSVLPSPARTRAAWDDLLERARRVPGVEAAAMVDTVPMREGNNQLSYSTSANLPKPAEMPLALATSVSPEYLKVVGLQLRRGRFFTDRDRAGGEAVVVIDDVLGQQAFGTVDAVGKRLWIPQMSPGPVTVVGVVGHVRHWGLAGDDGAKVRAQFYYPFAQLPDPLVRRWSELMSIVVRTSVPPLTLLEPLRREARATSNDQVLYEVRTLEQLAAGTLARQRFLMLLFGVFAGLALLLACVGVYGVLAYLTGQRIPEIGLRMALGATAGSVVRLVLRQSLGMVLAGVVLGSAAALAAGRMLRQFVEGMRGMDVATFALMVAMLVVAASVASFLPAWRASRIDPLRALRQD